MKMEFLSFCFSRSQPSQTISLAGELRNHMQVRINMHHSSNLANGIGVETGWSRVVIHLKKEYKTAIEEERLGQGEIKENQRKGKGEEPFIYFFDSGEGSHFRRRRRAACPSFCGLALNMM
jgi:hypothetical protein